ncbi:MAG: metal-dependent hydrolase [Alphaproteobacteria bacterium]|nr:metal-dependent hydrolase [Alphaproteobacteria bacterium]
MKITWYGHSTFRVETGSSVIMLDPFLRGNPTFNEAGLDFDEAIKGVTHVGLTHGHDDHFADAAEICKTNGATLFATYELALHVGAEKIEPMNTGGTVASDDFSLSLVNALHSSSSNGTYLGNPNGIVLTCKDGNTVYHMGDTDIFPGMDLVNKLFKPNIGIVPIGDRFTMGARTAAFACKEYFDFKLVLPCHYGTFPILDQSADKFVTAMSGQRVEVPKAGGSVDI